MNRRRVVRVPASSANLGPGYDVLAAALDLPFELEVEETGAFSLSSNLPGIPLDRSNLCVRAFVRLHPADGVSFAIRSEIPPAAGLGSSAAAIVAGLCAADHMYELDAPIFELARDLEGHPDNVAAALHGGFVICPGPGEEPVRFDPAPGLEGVLAIPDHEVPTAEARAAMPAELPVAEAGISERIWKVMPSAGCRRSNAFTQRLLRSVGTPGTSECTKNSPVSSTSSSSCSERAAASTS